MSELISQNSFLDKYRISKVEFDKTGLDWSELVDIYTDYERMIPDLECTASSIINFLLKCQYVHSVRYRIKDSEHVIEKIIRKKMKCPDRSFSKSNYRCELTDLIGVRVLHLIKEDWIHIHDAITELWDLEERVIAYYRKGDPDEYNSIYLSKDCTLMEHENGYRSIHYIVKTHTTKVPYLAEIQVRTIFEEGWSEIDHKIRYPNNTDNLMINQFLLLMNKLAGSADEMGSFVLHLKDELNSSRMIIAEAKEEIIKLKNRIKSENKFILTRDDKISILDKYLTFFEGNSILKVKEAAEFSSYMNGQMSFEDFDN